MSATLATITPVNKRLYSATTGAVTALGIDNRGEFATRVNLGGALLDIIPPGTSRTYPLGNVTNYGGWVLLCPVRSQATISELNRLGTQIILTTYGGADVIPYGSATQPGELAASADDLAGVDTFLSALWRRRFEVRTFGAQVDNVSDDTAPVQACLDGANVCGGGQILFPAGTCITQTLTDYSNVYLRGEGANVSILKLKNGTNGDLINGGSTNLSLINVTNQTSGNGNTGGLADWGISDLTLDGNKTNQSGTSYVLRVYGFNYTIRHTHVRNGLSGGALLDWNGGNTPAGEDGMEALLQGVKFRNNSGVGLTLGGPHDTQLSDVLVETSGSHGLYIGPHAPGILSTNLHSWGSGLGVSAVAMLVEASGCQFSNCVAEGSDTVQLVILANGCTWSGGNIYSSVGTPSSGIQLGQQAGQTPYAGSSYQSGGLTTAVAPQFCNVQTQMANVIGANGAIWFANDGGANILGGTLTQASGAMFTGTVANSTQFFWSPTGLGSGGANLPALQLGGSLVLGRSSEQTPTTGGTITTQGFSLIRCNPAGAVTGVILQQGSFYQFLVIRNQSAFSISFAAAATSHVADEAGGTNPIPANTARAFVYDVGTGKWYRCG